MQLNNIRGRISLAACSLLQLTSPLSQAADSDWDIDTALLYYSESDGRVDAIEPAVYAGRALGDDDRIDLRLVVDVLTGATPNGAHAIASGSQTFTTPSGNGSYTVAAGETPLDDTFHDTRVAIGADWTLGLARMSKVVLGFNASTEFDYLSLGVSSTYLRDFNNRNTTLKAGIAFNNDTIQPEGGIPTEFAPMVTQDSTLNRSAADDTKTITDFLIGVTQVIDRKTIMELNYTYGITDGYQNDPYKIVSVVNTAGERVSAADSAFFDTAVTGNLPYVYESRPDSRQRNTLFFRTARHLSEDVINFSYRYYWDDWGINSHTFDIRYRYQLANSYLQPHVRYYMQDAADFYTHNLVLGSDIDASGTVLLSDASNDYRLAESVTTTLGLKYGVPIGSNSEFAVRAELINQSLSEDGVPAAEQNPDLDAIVFQLNYSLVW